MRGTLLRRWGLALLGLCLGVAVAEALLRAVQPLLPVSELRGLHEYRPDRAWIYGLRPGARGRLEVSGEVRYRVNADGWRDRRHPRAKPAGVFRVVVLGDSIAFGYGVAEGEAFPQVLEAELASRAPDARVEVLNLGVGGYNPYNEAKLLEDVGVGYQPDLVLVQFAVNDLTDPTLHFSTQTRLRLGAIPDAAYPDPARRRRPEETPSLALRACHLLRLCTLLDDVLVALGTPPPDAAMTRAAAVPAEGGPAWEWIEARYQEMERAAAAAGARFAVLAFPHQAQLARRDPHRVQERLRELGERHGWPVIDPLPAFRLARARGERLFLDWWHPLPVGHRIAAEETLARLACGGLLPPAAEVACPDAEGERGHRSGQE